MLRELTFEEVAFVSGGFGEDTRSRMTSGTNFDEESWGDTWYSWGEYILDRAWHFFGSDYMTNAEQNAESERLISGRFNQTTTLETHATPNGWFARAADGWTYFDRDGDSVPESRSRVNDDGSLTIDNGSATSHVPAAGS